MVVFSAQLVVGQLDFEPKSSFRVEVGLPATLEVATNPAFRDMMQGLANVAMAYQFTFENSLSIGGGVRYSLFNVNEFKNTIDLEGSIHMVGAYGRIGSEKYWGQLGVDYGVNVGYNYSFALTNACRELNRSPNIAEGFYIEPTFGLSYIVDEKNAWTLLNLKYAVHDFRYQPDLMCVENFPGFGADGIAKRTSYLTFGFGYIHYFGAR